MSNYKDQVAVITGGAGGIAHGIATACLKEGMKIVLADIDAVRLEAQVAEFKRDYDPENIACITVDVTEEAQVKKMADFALKTFGRVDQLYNNAGLHFHKHFHLLTDNDFNYIIDANVWTIIYGMRVFLPILNKSGSENAAIINVASGAAVGPSITMSHYNLTKFGVLGMTQAVLQEQRLMGSKINFLTVMPAFVRSDLMDTAAQIRPPKYKNSVEEQTATDMQMEAFFRQGVATKDPEPLQHGAISNETAGERIMQALKDNKQFVYTHPEYAAVGEAQAKCYTEGYLPPMESLG